MKLELLNEKFSRYSNSIPMLNLSLTTLAQSHERLEKILPRDCSFNMPGKVAAFKSEIYLIKPGNRSVVVHCDMDDSGGNWTVIQRRRNGDTSFDRNWTDYALGFGRPQSGGDYWLGNEHLHNLTAGGDCELKVEMWTIFDEYYVAKYRNFTLGNATTFYRLTLSGYSGNATDALSDHNGMRFSTMDRDNDKSSTHCALYYCRNSKFNALINFSNSILIYSKDILQSLLKSKFLKLHWLIAKKNLFILVFLQMLCPSLKLAQNRTKSDNNVIGLQYSGYF